MFAAGFAIAQLAHAAARIVLINGRTRPKSTTGETQMRFMMIVIPKGYETAAPDAVPSAEAVAKMMVYNKSLQQAGVLLALDGLFSPSTGARVSFADGKALATDGPFAEAKEGI